MKSEADPNAEGENGSGSSSQIGPSGYGFPGETSTLFRRHMWTGLYSHLNEVPISGLPGDYRVTFFLGRPEFRATPERVIGLSKGRPGDSHLTILTSELPPGISEAEIWIDVETASGSFRFRGYTNNNGHLAQLETFPFHAQDRRDAELKATRLVQILLSEQSARLDIPLQIQFVEVTDLTTWNRSVTAVAFFPDTHTWEPVAAYDQEFAALAGLYREGLQSNSSIYRFLCFYKILEVSRKRREQLGRKSKAAGKTVRNRERVPSSQTELKSWLNAIFVPRPWPEQVVDRIFPAEARGKKLTALYDGELRRLRDQIAHGILDSGKYLLLDDPEEIREFAYWLPFLRCAVRRTLKNDFPERYLTNLTEDGIAPVAANPEI